MARIPFPNELVGLENLLFTFKTKLATYQTALNLTAADVSQAAIDYDVLETFRQNLEILEKNLKAVYGARKIIVRETQGKPVPILPPIAGFTLPAGTLTGIDERTRNLRNRIFDATGYNEEIGRDLGLEGDPGEDAVIEPPVLEIKDGLPGYDFEVTFKKKNHGGIRLEFARKGSDKFLFLTNKMKSPALAEVAPLADGSPELIRVRAIYLDNDEPVGDYSPEYPVTVVP